MIVHLRVVPGLGIAVEEQRRPEIRSHPVIMGGLPQQRGTVREANLAAQHGGVRAGMTLSQAHQYCPDGLFLVPDLPHYQAVWATICDALRDYTPLVEPVEMGQAACDLSGGERRWPDIAAAGREIAAQVQRVSGIVPRIGVASNRFVAQLASLAGDGLTVIPPGQERAFLAELPLTLLPELDPRLALTFQVLGLRTMSQFAALPPAAVKRRFGAVGERLYRYARGIDPRPVVPPTARPAVTARYACEEGSLEEVVIALRQLAQTCTAELQERGLAGHLVELSLIPFPSPTVPIEPAHPVDEGGRDDGHDEGRDCCSVSVRPAAPLESSPDRSVGAPSPLRSDATSLFPSIPSGVVGRFAHVIGVRGDDGALRATGIAGEWPHSAKADRDGATVPTTRSPLTLAGHPDTHPRKLRTLVRTPIGVSDAAIDAETAPPPEAPLLEHAQRLLLRHWPRPAAGEESSPWRVQTIELAVSEFAAPAQLSFAAFNRLDQTGGLAGLDPHRRRALEAQEEMLAARYRDTSFRHVASVDPGNILTERRVRWEKGLPWRPPARAESGPKDLKP